MLEYIKNKFKDIKDFFFPSTDTLSQILPLLEAPSPSSVVEPNVLDQPDNVSNLKFFSVIRKDLFNGFISSSQVKGINAILSSWKAKYSENDIRFLAYALATTYHETAKTMTPISEYGHGHGHKYGQIDHNKQMPFGRGYVQLTWTQNYELMDNVLNLHGELIKNYSLALNPDIASEIMFEGMIRGLFTGHKLSNYFNPNTDNPVGARRIINGLDRAELVAGYYKVFKTALGAK